MNFEIVAEYKCGHPPRTIQSIDFDLGRDIGAQITEAVAAAPKDKNGNISFVCEECGRPASHVVQRVDGRVVGRQSAMQVRAEGRGGVFVPRR
jgi:hypothetical protein